ncbi:MAG TPA: DUF4861 family protein [Fibrobacteria bacterium]|nr:DUF4861 family protein [Fibrobacteria bacterium]
MKVRFFPCLLALAALCAPSRAPGQAAVLFKNLKWTAHDRVPAGANPYGDLQGPAIENNRFALFVSAKGAHIHADMIGKRIPGMQLWRFHEDINRHGHWDWGEDILNVGTTLAAGTPALLVNGAIKTFDLAQMDSLVIAIPDSTAAHPELRIWAYGWRAGLPAPVDFRWTLRTRREDRFVQGEVTISPAAGATIVVGVIKAPKAMVRRDSSRAQLAMTGLPTYFNDSAVLAVRSAPAWFRGFMDQDGNVGLRLQPDAQGTVRWIQGGSWIQEPQPIWRTAGWESSWLPAPESPTALRPARAERRPGKRTWTLRRLDGRLVTGTRPALPHSGAH